MAQAAGKECFAWGRAAMSVPRALREPCELCIVEGAQAMDTLHTFVPNFDGPASRRAASCQFLVGNEAPGPLQHRGKRS